MVGNTPDALLANWKDIVNKYLSAGSRFSSVREHLKSVGIGFNVCILAPEQHELLEWVSKLKTFLSEYKFDVVIQHGVSFADVRGSTFDGVDLLIIFPLSNAIQFFCVEFAKEQSCASRMLVCVPEGDGDQIYCRALRESYGVETVTLPVRELLEGEHCRFGVDVVKRCADYLATKGTASIRQLRIQNTVVILVHGIRTRAFWQGPVKKALEISGLIAIPTNYEKFDVVRFLSPFETCKRLPIQKVEAEVRSARKRFSDAHISLLAHSFGTYITGKLLLSREHTFDRVAFCGSVLRSDFDFASAEGGFSKIVNEVGCHDIWPALAAKLSYVYGPTGSFGFNRGAFVEDRKHANCGHSHFLNAEFCERFWVPYFRDDSPEEPGDVGAMPSRLVRFIDSIWFWVCVAILIALALWALGFVNFFAVRLLVP